jgi:hypothetical protein
VPRAFRLFAHCEDVSRREGHLVVRELFDMLTAGNADGHARFARVS